MGRCEGIVEPAKAWRELRDGARAVFRDPFAIERLDDRQAYGEERFVIVGTVDARLLTVAYTLRGDRVRIISARGAEPDEHRQYHEENR